MSRRTRLLSPLANLRPCSLDLICGGARSETRFSSPVPISEKKAPSRQSDPSSRRFVAEEMRLFASSRDASTVSTSPRCGSRGPSFKAAALERIPADLSSRRCRLRDDAIACVPRALAYRSSLPCGLRSRRDRNRGARPPRRSGGGLRARWSCQLSVERLDDRSSGQGRGCRLGGLLRASRS